MKTDPSKFPTTFQQGPVESVENFLMPLKLSSFDIGAMRRMKYSVILRLLQEAAGRQLERAGLSYSILREKYEMVFLLIQAAVKIKELPKAGQNLIAETWFCGLDGARFLRGLRIYADGNACIEVGSQWIIANPDTHRIIRPSHFPNMEAFPIKKNDPLPVSFEKMQKGALFEENQKLATFNRRVQYSDLDQNLHLTNAAYVDLLCDYFPGGFSGNQFSMLQIEFVKEARLDETIQIRSIRKENHIRYEGRLGKKTCFLASAQLM